MGMLPIEWKTANITPIFKKGSKNSRENYRQRSLTGIICKIGEKVVRSRDLDFWYRMNILSENQFAYFKGKSTVTNLLSTVDDWVRSRNSGVHTDVIFLELAKAFDSVPHERLILKLRSYGIEGSLLSWFRHFITGRKQGVVIRGTFSEWSPVSSGTPQGTILGQILFLIYIHDITDCILSKVKLYADDTKSYREIKDPVLNTHILQNDLNSLDEWAHTWQLKFNVEKCETMRLTHSNDTLKSSYTLGTSILKDTESFKDLGVTVSPDLTWSKHICIAVNKANTILGTIKRSVGTANTKVFSMLYNALV
jgi:hypothetical protein